MTEMIGSRTAVRNAHTLAASALPNAPIVLDDEPAPRAVATRSVTAMFLRGLARSSAQLANRVDPVCS